MHGAGGPVHVLSVLLVEMFYLLVCLVAFFLLNFLIFSEYICCRYSKEPSERDCSFEQPKHMLYKQK